MTPQARTPGKYLRRSKLGSDDDQSKGEFIVQRYSTIRVLLSEDFGGGVCRIQNGQLGYCVRQNLELTKVGQRLVWVSLTQRIEYVGFSRFRLYNV